MHQTSPDLTVVSTPTTVLTAAQRTLLRVVLNRIVPANGALPGAGDLGVAEAIEQTLAATPSLRRIFADGLLETELTAASRGAADFADLLPEQQDALLHEVETTQFDFFSALVEHTYRCYYLLPAVHAAIGYETRPPQPLGYELPPFDESQLATQRQRTPFWRRTT